MIAALAAEMHAVVVDPSHALFHEGVEPESVYVVVDGTVPALQSARDDRVEDLRTAPPASQRVS